jgi:DnaJ-domain-containing protein 1
MPRVVVENHSPFGFFGDLQIVLDGAEQLRLSRREVTDFAVLPGVHTLQARSGDLYSDTLEFRAAERETLGFAFSASGVWRKKLTGKTLYHRRPDDRFGGPMSQMVKPASAKAASAPPAIQSDWAVVLNVADAAPMDEIRRAYLKLIWKYHPDRVVNLAGEQRAAAEHAARLINMAYAAAKKKRRSF